MTAQLASLSSPDLQALASAVERGVLVAPYSAESLSRYLNPAERDGISRELGEFHQLGAAPAAVARFLYSLAAASQGRVRDPFDLVLSGPDARGVPSRDTGSVVRELFLAARRSVLVVGFAVAQGREVFRLLGSRLDASPELSVTCCFDVSRDWGDTTPSAQLIERFAREFREAQWPGTRMPRVLYDPRSLDTDRKKRSSLHAKCVVVDREIAFVSSANFTEAAQLRNIEVGVLLRSAALAGQLDDYFLALERAGVLVTLPRS